MEKKEAWEEKMKRKMNKRLLSLLFVLTIMITTLVSGCGQKEEKLISKEAFTGDYLVTADYVKEHMKDDNFLIVDCRGSKAAKKSTPEGAIATTWQELCTCDDSYGESGDEAWGKIPEASDLSKRLGNLGMTMDKEIILVGETSSGWGDDARVLWELYAAGYQNIKMVDGGFEALEDAEVPMQKGASNPVAGTVSIEAIDKTHVMETDELTANYKDYVILDVRTEREYNGATKYGEAKGGHLPGAIFFPYENLFRNDGTLKSKADIDAMLKEAGVSKDAKIVTYCTGGIRSAYVQLVLEMDGCENTWNYDQSYWRWCEVNEVE